MSHDAEDHEDARWLREAVALAVGNVEAGGGPHAGRRSRRAVLGLARQPDRVDC
jgi:hypothetical protein